MKAFKAWFLNIALREKVMLLGFILIATVVWVSSVAGRLGRWREEFKQTSAILKNQSETIASRAGIEADSKKAIAMLDPARTLDSARLQGEINTLAAGLPNMQIDARPAEQTDLFSVHTVQFSVRKASWEALQRFYVELSKHSPYISIEQCSISADRANPAELNATMQISSVEIAR